MAITSWPFDGQTVTETEFSQWANMLHSSGVNASTDFTVTADSSGMNVSSAAGLGLVRGHAAYDTAPEVLTIETADTSARIDRVVLELDPSLTVPATIVRKIVKGTPGAGAPALTQTVGGVFQFPLAQVAVGAGVVTITAGNVTDERVLLEKEVTWATLPGKPSTFAPIIGSASNQAVAGNDARLSNARTPTAHTHPVSQVSDATATGEALVKASSRAAARSTVGVFVTSTPMNSSTAQTGDIRVW